jgi:hypothetical protein
MFNLPQMTKMVEAIEPQAGGAITGDYVSLKNCAMCYVVVHITQAAANTVAITLEQATSVGAGGTTPITKVVPIWANEDCAATDTLVAQTAAVAFTTSAAQKHKIVVFQVDPATFTLAGADCLTVKTGASAAGNITSAMYYLVDLRYQQATPPAAITD